MASDPQVPEITHTTSRRARKQIARELGYIPLHGKNHPLPMDTGFVAPVVIRHRDRQALGRYRDIEQFLSATQLKDEITTWHIIWGSGFRSQLHLEGAVPKEQQERPPFEASSIDDLRHTSIRAVVLGRSGVGKTTVLRYLGYISAQSPTSPVPILIEARRMEGTRTLREQIGAEISRRGWSLDAARLEGLLDSGRVMVLIDGVDEVETEDGQRRIEDAIIELASRAPRVSILASYRTAGYQGRLVGFDLIEVLGFDRAQQNAFVQKYFQDASKTHALKSFLDATPGFRQLASTPLLLSLLALRLFGKSCG